MKTIITCLLLILSTVMDAQQPLDTIYANDQMNVALFFPKAIRQGITGTENFAFTYNRDTEQYFGLLQATPGDESNLLAITTDGNVYAYILKYAKTLTKLNYFIEKRERIGIEKPEDVESTDSIDSLKSNKEASNYYRIFSDSLLKTKLYPTATVRKKGMVLKLLKSVYNKNVVYLAMEIKNRSGIDFELDYLNISKVKGAKGRKASYQKLEQTVLYKHQLPNVVLDKKTRQFVFVLPKFVFGDEEKLHIEAKELNGSRNINLKIRN